MKNRYTVEREDAGKADIFEGKRDRMFYIYDNLEDHPVEDYMTGETEYYDTYNEAQDYCEELNADEEE